MTTLAEIQQKLVDNHFGYQTIEGRFFSHRVAIGEGKNSEDKTIYYLFALTPGTLEPLTQLFWNHLDVYVKRMGEMTLN